MNTNLENAVPTVQVEGKEVLNFMPNSGSQGAIVPLSVIQRLSLALQKTSIEKIKTDMRQKLTTSRSSDNINTIERYIQVLQDEIDFHVTVNMLSFYEPEIVKETDFELMP